MDLGIYLAARKNGDHFSPLKTNNYLSYAMAALWVKQQKLNEALLLNSFDGIADATIANIFIVKDGIIKTPAISEGPVNGIMRRHLLKCIREANMPVEETRITVEELLNASEIFLTNAIYGIRWVKQLQKSRYTQQVSSLLYKKMVLPLF